MKYSTMVKLIEDAIRKSETPYINELAKQILEVTLANGMHPPENMYDTVDGDFVCELNWEKE